MPIFKFKTDEKGNFYSQHSFPLTKHDLIGPDSDKQAWVKLLKPKDAQIKVLTLTLNKKTKNVAVATGKLAKTGPFPLVEGKNPISFEGNSNKPDEVHEIEVTPQLLN